jgi:hypothetical protein
MSPSGRYQSRLFNFLSRQSLRIRDRSSQTWRQVKVATAWGVQILLYPIYVGFQTSRLVGKQIQQTVKQTLPRLEEAKQSIQRVTQPSEPSSVFAADTPIQNVLEAVQTFARSLPASQVVQLADLEAVDTVEVQASEGSLAVAPRSLVSPAPSESGLAADSRAITASAAHLSTAIQGVASLLETRKLVLVTRQNQILDILTGQQHLQLQRRIVWEIAHYWRQQRRFGAASAQPARVSNFLPLPKDRTNALPPVRMFRYWMAWMQVGPLAVTTNLFQESKLALHAATQTQLALNASSEQPLRSAQPSWVMLEVDFYDWLGQVNQSIGSLLISGLQGSTTGLTKLSARVVASLPQGDRSNPSAQLPAAPSSQLAQQGLDRLLSAPQTMGDRLFQWTRSLFQESSLVFQTPSDSKSSDKSWSASQTSPADAAQPWLTMEDLFQPSNQPVSAPFSSSPAHPPRQSDQPQQTAKQSFKQWITARIQKNTNPARSALVPVNKPESDWELLDTAAIEAAAKAELAKHRQDSPRGMQQALAKRRGRSSIQTASTTKMTRSASAQSGRSLVSPAASTPEPASEAQEHALTASTWIETEAKLVGYVKHPLEQLLEWLDRGMCWVEESIAQAWRWIRDRFT